MVKAQKRNSMGNRISSVAGNDKTNSSYLLSRLLKICGLLGGFLLVTYGVIIVIVHFVFNADMTMTTIPSSSQHLNHNMMSPDEMMNATHQIESLLNIMARKTQATTTMAAGADLDSSPKQLDNLMQAVQQWRISQSAPLDMLEDDEYQVYITIITWITILIAGLGSEFAVWCMFLKHGWSTRLQGYWQLAQFTFPLLAVVSLGLASQHDYAALLTLVLGLWKFGFPETLLYMYSALYATKSYNRLTRAVEFFDSIGTVLHHSAASLVICALITGVARPNRHLFDPILVLVIQHWVVLLKYVNSTLYILVEFLLEICFEWSVLSQFETFVDEFHWIIPVAAAGMLVAHWLYMIAAGLGILAGSEGGGGGTAAGAETTTMMKNQGATNPTTQHQAAASVAASDLAADFSSMMMISSPRILASIREMTIDETPQLLGLGTDEESNDSSAEYQYAVQENTTSYAV